MDSNTPSSNGKALAVFQYSNVQIRSMVDANGDPWFVAADVCKVLDISNVGNVLARLDTDEKDDIHTVDVMGRMQSTAIINESGLYSLILTSRKPEAKAFKKWITSEVLPAIRKTGGYLTKPMTALELLELNLAVTKEHEARLAEQDARIQRIEARQTGLERGSEYFTIVGYTNYKHLPPPSNNDAAALGKKAANLSRELGYSIGKTTDPRYGQVNTYHISVLDSVFGQR